MHKHVGKIVLGLLIVASAHAASIISTLPYNIQNGQAASATPVMGNFNAIVSNVNSNAAGLTLSNSFTQPQSVAPATVPSNVPTSAQVQGNMTYAVDTGTVNAYAIAPSPPISVLADGMELGFSTINANTTSAVTLAVNGLTAEPIVNWDGSALAVGQITTGRPWTVKYSGTANEFFIEPNLTFANVATATTATNAIQVGGITISGTPALGFTAIAQGATSAVWQASGGGLHTTLYFTAQNVPVTMTAASPVVVTVSNTQYLPQVGSPVQFTGSFVPSGVSLNFQYFVTAATSGGTTYTFSTTQGGTNVNGSGSGSSGISQASVYVKNSSASYIITEVWGAGGGGGGVTALSGYVGGGGGAGGYARQKILAANINATETITIGTGGTGGSTSGGTGGTGGTTSFGAHSSATGGGGGTGNSSSAPSPGGVAGSGSGGDINLTGQPGFSSEFSATVSYDVSGPGGATTLGGAGIGKAVANAAGANGANNSGSGGGGAATGGTAEAGGLGGSGMVIVYEYY